MMKLKKINTPSSRERNAGIGYIYNGEPVDPDTKYVLLYRRNKPSGQKEHGECGIKIIHKNNVTEPTKDNDIDIIHQLLNSRDESSPQKSLASDSNLERCFASESSSESALKSEPSPQNFGVSETSQKIICTYESSLKDNCDYYETKKPVLDQIDKSSRPQLVEDSSTVGSSCRRVNGKTVYVCNYCGRQFSRMTHARRHELVHTGEKRYQCCVCDKVFSLKHNRDRHLVTHSREKDHGCSMCGKMFGLKAHVKQHMQLVHKINDSFVCEVCGKQYYLKSQFTQHMLTHTQKVRNSKNLKKRVDSLHEKEAALIDSLFSIEESRCKGSETDTYLKGHEMTLPEKCPSPSENTVNSSSESIHCGVMTSQETENIYLDTVMSEELDSSEAEMITIQAFIEEKRIDFDAGTCEGDWLSADEINNFCSSDKGSNDNFITPEENAYEYGKQNFEVTRNSKYFCRLCKKTFTNRSSIYTHMLIHAGNRKHSCPVCGKSFLRGGHLKRHMVVHSGKKEYCCWVCGKQFALKDAVTKHMLVHDEEKKYKCGVCGKRFVRKANLKQHSVVHDEYGVNFSCPLCPKQFRRQADVKKHLVHYHKGR